MAIFGASLAAGGASAACPERLRVRTIASSGEEVPAIGLGTYRTFDVGPPRRERTRVEEVLRQFVAIGGQIIDSSPMYGRAERVVGDLAIKLGIEKKLFYATKVWTRGRKSGIEQMNLSMLRMRTARMDLMQIHNLVDWRTHIKTLYQWKEEGRVRYIGITHYINSAFNEVMAIMEKEPLDFIQIPYNIVNREAEIRLLPLATTRGIAVLVNEPFEQGALFRQVRGKTLPHWAAEFDCASWAQFFLKYIISHSAVTCPIPATSKLKHLLDNMQAGFGRLPDETERRRMANYMDAL